MLKELSLTEFSTRLASEQPAPGGGSASAAVAALGAGLLIMTCNLTIGREKFQDAEEDLMEVREELEPIRVMLLASIDRDSEAYIAVMDAYGMPKTTPEEKAERKAAIQKAMVEASEVPMDMARRAGRALDLASIVAGEGNPNALSDAGCGARFLEAGLRGALYNVRINLPSIKDEAYVAEMTSEVERLSQRADEAMAKVLAIIESGL
ncbi:MAG: methenyltetrahydrofolate cyclohydrolase [Thermoplasmata archaeon]|nr:methenyltetrahydrofolate cyclohydrolase [Thermoplasmata archaeon]